MHLFCQPLAAVDTARADLLSLVLRGVRPAVTSTSASAAPTGSSSDTSTSAVGTAAPALRADDPANATRTAKDKVEWSVLVKALVACLMDKVEDVRNKAEQVGGRVGQ